MYVIISPSKTQDITRTLSHTLSLPFFDKKSRNIIKHLRSYSPQELSVILKLSPKLESEVLKQLKDFNITAQQDERGTASLCAFTGFVFKGLQPETYGPEQLNYAQKHIGILSALYGVLRPLDIMQAYRLDLADGIKINGNNLYEYWSAPVNEYINKQLLSHNVLLNLASNEYSRIINEDNQRNCVNIHFKDWKGGGFKLLGTYAKQARGWMLDHIIKQQIRDVEDLKSFSKQGYSYNQELSDLQDWVFTRNNR